MRLALVLVLAVASCGSEPGDPECSIRCTDSEGCANGLTCSAGFCAAEGRTCEPDFAHVATGAGFACALDQFHRTWCWGSNEDRQIEDSDRVAFERAVVIGDRRWDSIAVGGGHMCGLEDNELWCWGRNDRNQVSDTMVGDVAAPLRIEIAGETARWSYVSTGFDYTCAIAGGRLLCWGAGDVGKLGTGDVNDAGSPRDVLTDLHDWTVVATGLRHTCAISTSAGAFCWGDGSSGQLGDGSFVVRNEPVQVALQDAANAIAVGLDTTCAVTRNGELDCWGRAGDGALGDPAVVDPTGANTATPIRASDLDGWSEVALAEHYACARRDGEVWCWGTALGGGIGDGHWSSNRVWVRALDDASELDVGWNGTASDRNLDETNLDLSCAIVLGTVRCWGDNRHGQLAQGSATRTTAPVELAGGHAWSLLVAGPAHICGIAGGDAYCWGSTELGQVAGYETGGATACTPGHCDIATPAAIAEATGTSTLAIGLAHTCALHGTAISCWGDNASGQCGPAPSGPIPPTAIAGTFSALVGGGASGACGVTGTETWCWGDVLAIHAPAHDAPLDGATALALGNGFGCALDATSQLACFGSNANGRFGNGAAGTCGDATCNADETAITCAADCGPPPLTHLGRAYTQIASGSVRPFTCGVRADARVECWGDNQFGESGPLDVQPVTIPIAVTDLTGCTQLATGGAHACAICSGGLACWGDASHGELGAPVTFQPVATPRFVEPPAGEPWIQVTAGAGFTCAVTQSTKGYCWGSSSHGALGTGATSANLPVTVQH